MKKYLLMLTIVLAVFACYSCSSDDDDDYASSPIVGTWVGFSTGTSYTITMNANGSGTRILTTEKGTTTDSYNYEYNGTKLTIKVGSYYSETYTVNIASEGNIATMTNESGYTVDLKKTGTFSTSLIVGTWKGMSSGITYTMIMQSNGNGSFERFNGAQSVTVDFTYTYDGATLTIITNSSKQITGCDIASDGKTAVWTDSNGETLDLTRQ